MARRRLDVSNMVGVKSPERTAPTAPIAAVAGEAATLAAAEAVTTEMSAARAEGRLAVRVPLEAIDPGHFARDRMGVEDAEMDALIASIRAHGQRMPLDLMAGEDGRYALISGWRRLTALGRLHEETGEARFGEALAVIRTPADAGSAYVAMVEENEIRVGLSYYERARIAVLAAQRGAFESPQAAIDALYASGSKAKRSKIRAFLSIHEALGEALSYPQALSERVGLAMAAGLKEGQSARLKAALTPPAPSPEAEAAALTAALKGGDRVSRAKPDPERLAEGVEMQVAKGRVTLSGKGVTTALVERLRRALAEQ